MDIVDILTLANAGFTAEQISAMSAQQATKQAPFPAPRAMQTAQPAQIPAPQTMPAAQPAQIPAPQTMPAAQPAQIPAIQAAHQMPFQMVYPPQNAVLTPAPMPPVPAQTKVAGQTAEATPSPTVPGNPSPEQLAGQLAQAQATNLNGVTVSPAQKVSIEGKLQDHYRALMGVSEDKKGD